MLRLIRIVDIFSTHLAMFHEYFNVFHYDRVSRRLRPSVPMIMAVHPRITLQTPQDRSFPRTDIIFPQYVYEKNFSFINAKHNIWINRYDIKKQQKKRKRNIYIHRDEIVLLLHEPRYVQRLCFFTCKQLWITKKWKRRGWVEKRKAGRVGGREGGRETITKSSATRCCQRVWVGPPLLFQSVRYFSPHQLVLRRWQLVQFGASHTRWPIIRAFSPCRVRVSPTRARHVDR